jgi:hypothetical protein
MDKELKAKWVAALRSGEYEQGEGSLYEGGKFCCLGVLHKVLTGEAPSERLWDDACEMPEEIRDQLDSEVQTKLAHMNDGSTGEVKHDFAEIADYIEAHL